MELSKEQKLIQTIINKAWEDEAFKQELVANPIAAIEQSTGEKLNIPEGKQLVIRDQTDEKTIYINIPSEPNMEDVELNDQQLEAVAGGIYIPNVDWSSIGEYINSLGEIRDDGGGGSK